MEVQVTELQVKPNLFVVFLILGPSSLIEESFFDVISAIAVCQSGCVNVAMRWTIIFFLDKRDFMCHSTIQINDPFI